MPINLITSSLEELFEYQLMLWANQGIRRKDLLPLRLLLPKKDVRRGKSIIPILIIPKCEIAEHEVVNHLDRQHLKNVVEVPQEHYLVFDFDAGTSCLDRDPIACHNEFTKIGRTSVVVKEGVIASTFFPMILNGHNLDLPGTLSHGDAIPYITRDGETTRILSRSSEPDDRFSSVSCRLRVGLR